ncbi:hypothetical protein RSSM_06577 [Rhodopirellula sallentina SM41]|uniref:Integron gene cassette protein n=2 Tax=Rhodopirellula TaxID=265488 RepID=M5U2A5_9BACT|nr:hypothetical protein RSSM_06577 [Rhodopirellula sallentina SM41]
MGFEIFAMSDDAAALPTREEFLTPFGDAIKSDADGWMQLDFGGIPNSCDVSYSVDDSGFVRGFTVFRPVTSPLLWAAIFALIRDYQFFVMWPGDCAPVVGDSGTPLPQGLADDFGDAIVAQSENDLPRLIKES